MHPSWPFRRIIVFIVLLISKDVLGQQCACSNRSSLLKTFYDATSGGAWHLGCRWDTMAATFPCSAAGITCDATRSDVTQILLSGCGLVGTLPPGLSALTALTHFAVNNNTLTGSIPEAYSAWRSLLSFGVASNALVGNLPSSFSAWTSLNDFTCAANHLNGTLPADWSAWMQITTFQVNDNALTGSLPPQYSDWGAFLNFLYIYKNLFSGTLPPSYKAWTNVTLWYGANNSFTGTLPQEYSAWTSIEQFQVQRNSLSGALPPSYSGWSKIVGFVAFNNSFIGTLPEEYQAWRVISYVDVGSNSFSGTLPVSYGSWKTLTFFAVGQNSLSGTLPPQYRSWTLLTQFIVINNMLSGSLPPEYSSWSSLTSIDVSGNRINGTLPPSYKNWTSIQTIHFYSNDISGSLPAEYSAWRSMGAFYISLNTLSGTLPGGYSSWTNVNVFDVQSNQISGTLPASYASWTMVTHVYMNNNLLTGTLPSQYSAWRLIVIFDIDINKFVGSLPSSWQTWTEILSFSASTTNLSGSLPPEYSAWTKLQEIFLYDNALNGTLPAAYSAWSAVILVRWDGNRFTGTLPPQYSSWAALQRLYVFANSLIGTIPALYGNIATMTYFQAHDNSLSGTIPIELVTIPTLKLLSVGYNKLNGALPSRCSSTIQVFSVQNNTLITGSIPPQLGAYTPISVCGTQVCPTTTWFLQYCFPRNFSFTTTSQATMLSEAQSYLRLCTVAPPVAQYSKTLSVAIERVPTPKQSIATVSAPTRGTTSAATYTALLSTGNALSRGALPGLQRSASVLRMMGACNAPGSSSEPLYSLLQDNPLKLQLQLGVPDPLGDIDFAAGAALGNTLLVVAVGVALHIIRYICMRLHHSSTACSRLVMDFVSILPSALLPGSLAVAFGTLLQPSLGASIALIASTERSGGTVAYGALFLCVWLALPTYYVWAVIWRGRKMSSDGEFALGSVEIRTLPARHNNNNNKQNNRLNGNDSVSTIVRHMLALRSYAMSPTHRWARRQGSGASKRDVEFLLENMESVYEAYLGGREWYFAVQWALAAASGIALGALQVIGNDDASLACPTAYAGCGVSIAFGAADITLLLVVRPTAVRLELWSGVMISALNIVSQALAASNAIDASNTLVTVSALLELAVMLLLMLNGVTSVAQGEGEELLRAAEGEHHMGARYKIKKLEVTHNDTTMTHRSAKSTQNMIVVKAHQGKSVERVPIVHLHHFLAGDVQHRLKILVKLASRRGTEKRK